jgi:hypothetical protein
MSKLAALRAFRNDPIALLERLATYGDVVRVDVPGSAAFLLNHPDLVRDVLVLEHRSFHKGPTIQAAKMLLGESLLTSEDETHLRRRRLIQPMFHHERIATYAADLGTNWVGDKLQSGDKATPEGSYKVIEKKGRGESRYHKALLINYPNEDDRSRFRALQRTGRVSRSARIGGLIEIHGEGGRGYDWTLGCVALTNRDIDALYSKVSVGTPVVIVGALSEDVRSRL